MSRVNIPHDRTQKQPVTGYCRNPECWRDSEAPQNGRFEFTVEHAPVVCPKCGADRSPLVGILALTHALIRDKDGKIRGKGGLRYRLACEATRTVLATPTNNEAATDNPEFVNCPGCLAELQKYGIVQPTGLNFTA